MHAAVVEFAVCVTRLGDFWKFLAKRFLSKVAQIFGNLLGYSEKHYFVSKNCCGSFFALAWEIWATFYSKIWSHWFQFIRIANFHHIHMCHTPSSCESLPWVFLKKNWASVRWAKDFKTWMSKFHFEMNNRFANVKANERWQFKRRIHNNKAPSKLARRRLLS